MARKKKSSPRPAAALAADLAPLRQGIDAIDDQLIELLNKRAGLAQRIGQLKARAALPAYVPERERLVLNRLVGASRGPLPEDSLRLIYKEIISASLALESPLTVAFVGPPAGAAHEAGKRHFGLSARLTAQNNITEVFDELHAERCAYGVVPIENTAEGLEHGTLDMFISSDAGVCAEIVLRKNYHLLTATGSLAKVTRVYAEPQDRESCRRWLETHLPEAVGVSAANPAQAAQLAQADAGVALLVTGGVAASLYGLQVAASNLKEGTRDTSRYWIIGHDEPQPTGKDRTSVLFAVKDTQGILYKGLQVFARAKVNLTRIESRPARRRNWDYLFFIDLEGHKQDAAVKRALAQLAEACVFMKILGSYPQARPAARAGGGYAKEL